MRVLKRKRVQSTSTSLETTLRLISHKSSRDKKSKLYLTINNKSIENGYWDVPKESKLTDNLRTYCKDYDIYIDVPMTVVKEFLNSYKKGLFIEKS